MTAAYPKMLFAAAGRGTVSVNSPEEERERLAAGYVLKPSDVHREPQRTHAPDLPAGTPLTEAHIPLIVEHVARALGAALRETGSEALTTDHVEGIVDAVFERLKGMAVAAAGEPAHREAADAVASLREDLDARFAALKGELVAELRPAAQAAAAAPKKA